MKVRTTRTDGVVTLSFEDGDALDAHAVPGIKRDALPLIDGTANVVIDLATVEFIDSSGVGLLVTLFKTVRGRGRRTAFGALRPEVRRVMEIIKLDRIFELHPDVASAVRALSG
jgi:anti-sigma B factor antagonist